MLGPRGDGAETLPGVGVVPSSPSHGAIHPHSSGEGLWAKGERSKQENPAGQGGGSVGGSPILALRHAEEAQSQT